MYYKKQFIAIIATIVSVIVFGQTPQKYAVLIGGDPSATNIPAQSQWNAGQNMGLNGFDEFWNDTYLMWEILYSKKGYSNNNIFVLFNDGIDYNPQWLDDRYKSFPSYNIPQITDYSASKANIQSVFSSLATTVTDDDFLYVWIMSHGWNDDDTQNGIYHSWVYLQGHNPANPNAGKLYDYELKTLLDAIPALKKVVFIQAPGSSGFADQLQNTNTVIFTSSQQNESSYRADDKDKYGNTIIENEVISNATYHHGEFGFHIYSPLTHPRL